MKHSLKIVVILLGMFFVTQLIGLAVIHAYAPTITQQIDANNNTVSVKTYDLPYGTSPPPEAEPKYTLFSIVIAFIISICLILLLMKFKAEVFLRFWFLFVITLALGITINSVLKSYLPYSSLISLAIAAPLAAAKIFKRNVFVHNGTELLVYPGIAAIFVPLMNLWTAVILFIIISIYDMYAVWQSGMMQKMAKYQMESVKVFSGFFIPYLGKKEAALVAKAKNNPKSLKMKEQKLKVNVAILGGGDVVFPIILAGVVLLSYGLIPALMISLGATIALGCLFAASQKGKFYPAMPFITAGCFIALGLVVYLF